MRQLDHTLLLTSSNFGVWADGFWSNRKGLNNVVLHCRCRTGPTGSSRSLLKLSIWVANYEIHSESDNKADNSRNWWHTLIFWVIFWPRFFDRMVWPIIAIANGLPIVWPANNPRMLKLVPNIPPMICNLRISTAKQMFGKVCWARNLYRRLFNRQPKGWMPWVVRLKHRGWIQNDAILVAT